MAKIEKIAQGFSCIAAGGLIMLVAAIGVGRLLPSTMYVMETVLLCSAMVIAVAGLGIVSVYTVDSVVRIKNHGVREWLRGFVPNPPQTLREKAQWLCGGVIVAGLALALASLPIARLNHRASNGLLYAGIGMIIGGVGGGILDSLVDVALEIVEATKQEARNVRHWAGVIKIWLRGLRKNR